MNSLDVVPNSVAQVAAAIEEKRAHQHHRQGSSGINGRRRSVSSPARSRDMRRKPSFTPGRAFAAPRQQSLNRQRAQHDDIEDLRYTLDSSPRKHQPRAQGITLKKVASNISFGNLSIGGRTVGNDSTFRAMAFRTPEPKNLAPEPDSGAESVGSIRERMRRMASFNSLSSRAAANGKSNYGPWQENIKPPARPAVAPYTLGLSSSSERPTFEVPMQVGFRPATSQDFRERLDRSRFEFTGVRRKPSVSASIRERSNNWWGQMRQKAREKEREGWI